MQSASGWLTLAIAIVLIAAAAPVGGGETSVTFVIRSARIFDGEKIIASASVVVTDGKIAAVGSNVQAPSGAQVIDANGDTLMPGLIDSHVHIWTRDVLASALAFGVTTELDMFMRWREAKNWKEQESKGAFDISELRARASHHPLVTAPRKVSPYRPSRTRMRRRRSSMRVSRKAPITSRLCTTSATTIR
jgi:hypothetical protein